MNLVAEDAVVASISVLSKCDDMANFMSAI